MPRSNKKKYLFKTPSKSPPSQNSSFASSSSSTSLSTTSTSFKCERILMVNRAISSAKRHGIILAQGTPNKADGNCALESAILNLKDRDCFSDRLPFSTDYYRRIWMTDMKNRTMNDETWNIYSKADWEAGWNAMMESGVYEQGLFGDLMLFGIVCGLKKVMLIFNTSLDSPHDPVYICDPRKF